MALLTVLVILLLDEAVVTTKDNYLSEAQTLYMTRLNTCCLIDGKNARWMYLGHELVDGDPQKAGMNVG